MVSAAAFDAIVKKLPEFGTEVLRLQNCTIDAGAGTWINMAGADSITSLQLVDISPCGANVVAGLAAFMYDISA